MKKYVKAAFVAAIVAVSGYNIYQSDGICRTNIDYTAICNYYDIWDPCPCGF